MKVAFWSNSRHECGVTTNMACIATLAAIAKTGKTVMLANHYKRNNGIEDIIFHEDRYNFKKSNEEWYYRNGIEYVLKGIYTGAKGEELIRSVAIPLLYTSMYYIPQETIFNKEVFNYDFSLVQNKVFNSLENFADFVFVDTESNQNLSSRAILHNADLIVVNLSQNPFLIRDFFDNYASLRDKAVFLIGLYQQGFAWSFTRICYEFKIPRNRIGVIPYNMELAEAMSSGRLMQFINRNYYKPSGNDNTYFINKSKNAAMMIRKNMLEIKRQNIAAHNKALIDRVCEEIFY